RPDDVGERNGSLLLQYLSHMQSEEKPMFDPLCKLRPRPGSPPSSTGRGFFYSVSSCPPPIVSCYRTCAADRTAARRAASPSAMAATNKCLAQMNKSRTAAKATREQDRRAESPY